MPPKATKTRKSRNAEREMNRDVGNNLNTEQDPEQNMQNDSNVIRLSDTGPMPEENCCAGDNVNTLEGLQFYSKGK